MKTYYMWLGLMVAIVAAGLPAAGWLYENLSLGWAIIVDILFIIVPFSLVSWQVIMNSLGKHKGLILINIGIMGLWMMTFVNIFSAIARWV